MTFQLFHHTISFDDVNPLDDGLGDEIKAEQMEPEAITLEEGVIEGQLEARWQSIEQDMEKDPEWFRFENE